jgi:SHS2 domain-containing protein
VGTDYRILNHTADIGVEVHGTTLEGLFSQAALALVDLLTDRTMLSGSTEKLIHIEGSDIDELWINYLREILYLFNGDQFLVKGVQGIAYDCSSSPAGVDVLPLREKNTGTGWSLAAHCFGDIYDPCCHVIKTEIKAVTYHRAEVKQTPEGWQGVFIVDV